MRNTASASIGAEDGFARNCAAQSMKRYCFLFSDTVYAVSVFVLLCLVAAAVVIYYLQVRVTMIVFAVLNLSLLAAWLVYYPKYKMSA